MTCSPSIKACGNLPFPVAYAENFHGGGFIQLHGKQYVETINFICAGNKVFVNFQTQGGGFNLKPSAPCVRPCPCPHRDASQASVKIHSTDLCLFWLKDAFEFQYLYIQHLQFATGNLSRHPKSTRKPFYCHVCCHSFSTSREVDHTFAPSESDTTNLQHVAMENLRNIFRMWFVTTVLTLPTCPATS